MRANRFFLALVTGLLAVSGLYFGAVHWQLGVPTDDSYWTHEINRRKLEGAARIKEPKLLLVGGSATLFGVCARQIEEELGVPTMNMGTHAALGPSYILRLTRSVIHPGDTVLLVIEYDLYDRAEHNTPKWAGDEFISYLMGRDPAYFRRLPLRHQIQLALGTSFHRIRTGMERRLSPQPPPSCDQWGMYDPRCVDDHGDLTGRHLARKEQLDRKSFVLPATLKRGLPRNPAAFAVLAQFVEWARAHDVRVLAAYPNICRFPELDSPRPRRVLEEICEFYRGIDVPILGTAQDAMLPRSDFLDTQYHLSEEAAVARTGRLLALLKPFFGSQHESRARQGGDLEDNCAGPPAGISRNPRVSG